eukprot:TRINITY_DN37212_c0_g1_i1.p1 TRINITY_DN37212_c0_g1~~TRINITY_DN37212_c0_g1_i1.p1  ORF type:complete len:596 (+),score=49.44 TRINITY_DN37212_c0_g1_i1:57-1844(+)
MATTFEPVLFSKPRKFPGDVTAQPDSSRGSRTVSREECEVFEHYLTDVPFSVVSQIDDVLLLEPTGEAAAAISYFSWWPSSRGCPFGYNGGGWGFQARIEALVDSGSSSTWETIGEGYCLRCGSCAAKFCNCSGSSSFGISIRVARKWRVTFSDYKYCAMPVNLKLFGISEPVAAHVCQHALEKSHLLFIALAQKLFHIELSDDTWAQVLAKGEAKGVHHPCEALEIARESLAAASAESRPHSLLKKLPEVHGEHHTMSPEMLSLTWTQFRTFMEYVRKTKTYKALRIAKQGKAITSYHLNDMFVVPWTTDAGSSIALLHNPEGLAAKLMVSHAWAADNEEVEEALQIDHVKRNLPSDLPVWMCLFAVHQPRGCQTGRPSEPGGPAVDDELALATFEKVIRSPGLKCENGGHGLVAAHTLTANIYGRLWCVFEIQEAITERLVIQMAYTPAYDEDMRKALEYYMQLTHGDENAALDLWPGFRTSAERADCASERTRILITEKIQSHGGFHRLDNTIFMSRRKLVLDQHGTSVKQSSAEERSCSLLERIANALDAQNAMMHRQTIMLQEQGNRLQALTDLVNRRLSSSEKPEEDTF